MQVCVWRCMFGGCGCACSSLGSNSDYQLHRLAYLPSPTRGFLWKVFACACPVLGAQEGLCECRFSSVEKEVPGSCCCLLRGASYKSQSPWKETPPSRQGHTLFLVLRISGSQFGTMVALSFSWLPATLGVDQYEVMATASVQDPRLSDTGSFCL